MRHLRVAALTALAGLLAAGCSADITRFDGKGYGLTDSNSANIPPQGMRRGEATKLGDYGTDSTGGTSSGGAYYPPPSSKPSGAVRSSSLPEPIAPAGPPPAITSRPPAPPHVASNTARPAPAHQSVQAKPIAAGTTIEVAHGDTLYGLAKKHAVPVNELMSINSLTSPTIKPGQKLVLPASRSIARAPTPQKPIQRAEAPVRVRAIAQPGEVAAPVSPVPVAVPSNWTGTHAVRNGESIYAIAKQHRVSFMQLQQVNGIADPTKVRAGTVLKVPAGQVVASTAPEAIAPPAAPIAAAGSKVAGAVATSEPARTIQTPTRPVIINSAASPEKKVAAVDPIAPPAETPAVEAPVQKAEKTLAASGKFRWPVKGRVIANYGPKSDSTHNDGINIAVPQGTEVLAAEQGTVAYAGSELKGYGNLILIRHDNGYVTAYAHNEEILVKRGDKVKRGQPIAKAGKTGTVDQPQVHFEIRQGQKPVDPMPHMERL